MTFLIRLSTGHEKIVQTRTLEEAEDNAELFCESVGDHIEDAGVFVLLVTAVAPTPAIRKRAINLLH